MEIDLNSLYYDIVENRKKKEKKKDLKKTEKKIKHDKWIFKASYLINEAVNDGWETLEIGKLTRIFCKKWDFDVSLTTDFLKNVCAQYVNSDFLEGLNIPTLHGNNIISIIKKGSYSKEEIIKKICECIGNFLNIRDERWIQKFCDTFSEEIHGYEVDNVFEFIIPIIESFDYTEDVAFFLHIMTENWLTLKKVKLVQMVVLSSLYQDLEGSVDIILDKKYFKEITNQIEMPDQMDMDDMDKNGNLKGFCVYSSEEEQMIYESDENSVIDGDFIIDDVGSKRDKIKKRKKRCRYILDEAEESENMDDNEPMEESEPEIETAYNKNSNKINNNKIKATSKLEKSISSDDEITFNSSKEKSSITQTHNRLKEKRREELNEIIVKNFEQIDTTTITKTNKPQQNIPCKAVNKSLSQNTNEINDSTDVVSPPGDDLSKTVSSVTQDKIKINEKNIVLDRNDETGNIIKAYQLMESHLKLNLVSVNSSSAGDVRQQTGDLVMENNKSGNIHMKKKNKKKRKKRSKNIQTVAQSDAKSAEKITPTVDDEECLQNKSIKMDNEKKSPCTLESKIKKQKKKKLNNTSKQINISEGMSMTISHANANRTQKASTKEIQKIDSLETAFQQDFKSDITKHKNICLDIHRQPDPISKNKRKRTPDNLPSDESKKIIDSKLLTTKRPKKNQMNHFQSRNFIGRKKKARKSHRQKKKMVRILGDLGSSN